MSLIKLKQLVATQSREIGTPSDGNYQDGLLPFVPTTLISDAFDAINVALTGSVLWVNSGSYIARTSDVQITGSLNVSNSGSFNYLQISGSTIETSNIISFGTASLYRVDATDIVTLQNKLIVSGSIISNNITSSGVINSQQLFVGLNSASDENLRVRISNDGTGKRAIDIENYTLSSLGANKVYFYRKTGTPNNPGPFYGNNYKLTDIRFYGYTDSDVYGASIAINSTGSYSSGAFVVPTNIIISTAPSGGITAVSALKIDENQMTTAYKGLYSWRLSFMSSSTGRYVDTISDDISLSGSSNYSIVTENAIKSYVDSNTYWTGSSGELTRYSNVKITGSLNVSEDINANSISASSQVHTPYLTVGIDSSSAFIYSLISVSNNNSVPVLGVRNYSTSNTAGPVIYTHRTLGRPGARGGLSSSISYVLADFDFNSQVNSSAYNRSARILVKTTGSHGFSRVPGMFEFYTATDSNIILAMTIDNNQLVTTYKGLHTNTLSFINSTTGKQANRFSTDTTLSGSSNTTLVSENAVKVYVDTVSSSIASTIVSLNSGSWYGLNGGEIRRSSNIQITGSSPVKIKQTTTDDETPAISIFKTGNGFSMWPVIEFNAADDDFSGGYATLNGNEGLGKLKFNGHNGTTFIPSIEIYGLLSQGISVTPGTNTTAGELQFRVVRYNEESVSNLLLLNTNLTSSYGLQVSKFGLGNNKRKVTLISTDTTLSGSSNSSIVTENVVKSYVQSISSSFASTIDGGTF